MTVNNAGAINFVSEGIEDKENPIQNAIMRNNKKNQNNVQAAQIRKRD